jgi:hypothetical protein
MSSSAEARLATKRWLIKNSDTLEGWGGPISNCTRRDSGIGGGAYINDRSPISEQQLAVFLTEVRFGWVFHDSANWPKTLDNASRITSLASDWNMGLHDLLTLFVRPRADGVVETRARINEALQLYVENGSRDFLEAITHEIRSSDPHEVLEIAKRQKEQMALGANLEKIYELLAQFSSALDESESSTTNAIKAAVQKEPEFSEIGDKVIASLIEACDALRQVVATENYSTHESIQRLDYADSSIFKVHVKELKSNITRARQVRVRFMGQFEQEVSEIKARKAESELELLEDDNFGSW